MSSDSIEYKAVRGAIQRAARAGGKAQKRTTRVARSVGDRPEYDGDNDGFITNPLTGEDNIPWNKQKETAEEAIAKFFGGRSPAALGKPIGKKPAKKAGTKIPKTTPQPKPAAAAAPAAQSAQSNALMDVVRQARWPKGADGKLVAIDKLSDTDLERVASQYEGLDVNLPQINGLVSQLQAERAARAERSAPAPLRARPSATPAPAMPTRWDSWSPDPRWKTPSQPQFSWENAVAEERLKTDNVFVEVLDARQHQFEQDGYVIAGMVWDDNEGEWVEWDPFAYNIVHNSVEDAMKFAEDLDETLSRNPDLDPYDPEFPLPEANQISGSAPPAQSPWQNAMNRPAKSKTDGRLGEPRRAHNFVSEHLEQARAMFEQKWNDRRRTASVDQNIEFAQDRITELELAFNNMGADYSDQFPGMDEAWNMSADDFAKWAKEAGIVDSLMEGRSYHRELLDVWDQLAADQAEMSAMIGEMQASLDSFIGKWNEKYAAEHPDFPMTYDEYRRQD